MNCPGWIYDICVARTASEFLHSELAINAFSLKYSSNLSEIYTKIEPEYFEEPAEEILKFLLEIQAGENAAEYLEHYTYFRLYFENTNIKRKLNPMFGSIEDPAKNVEADKAKVFKSFKAFVFSLRSSYVDETPAGWTLEGDENIPKISEIAAKEVDILDMF
jgi:hypothetical protein